MRLRCGSYHLAGIFAILYPSFGARFSPRLIVLANRIRAPAAAVGVTAEPTLPLPPPLADASSARAARQGVGEPKVSGLAPPRRGDLPAQAHEQSCRRLLMRSGAIA